MSPSDKNVPASQDLFTDVTSGNNKCCAGYPASTVTCCRSGFEASESWDPVTVSAGLHENKQA
jgi:hypothetical protein